MERRTFMVLGLGRSHSRAARRGAQQAGDMADRLAVRRLLPTSRNDTALPTRNE